MNQVMKVLTIFASIMLPLTFLAGVWGMNFRHMPELFKPWGYPVALGSMAITALGLIWFFRRRHWM
jgi:magnesium transporter